MKYVKDNLFSTGSRKRKSTENTVNERKMVKITDSFNCLNKNKSKSTADELITNYIVCSGVSLNTVNHPHFKLLVNGLSKLNNEVNCFSTKTLQNRIQTNFESMHQKYFKKY